MSALTRTSLPPFTTNATECQIMNLGFIAIVPPERIAAPHRTIEKVELSIPDKTTMSARSRNESSRTRQNCGGKHNALFQCASGISQKVPTASGVVG